MLTQRSQGTSCHLQRQERTAGARIVFPSSLALAFALRRHPQLLPPKQPLTRFPTRPPPTSGRIFSLPREKKLPVKAFLLQRRPLPHEVDDRQFTCRNLTHHSHKDHLPVFLPTILTFESKTQYRYPQRSARDDRRHRVRRNQRQRPPLSLAADESCFTCCRYATSALQLLLFCDFTVLNPRRRASLDPATPYQTQQYRLYRPRSRAPNADDELLGSST